MRLVLEKELQYNERVVMGRLGYHSHLDRNSGAMSYVRRLQSLDYPRFHVYIDHENGRTVYNVHLDEKKPSYAGTARHSGQYDGELVQQEIDRISGYLSSL
jgi:hypothetical protein